jgi:hypothetical protein
MSRRLTFKGSDLQFPGVCLVCQLPAEKKYDVSRTISYGNRTITISLPIPLCQRHHDIAVQKSPAEILVGRAGLVLGCLAGIATPAALLVYWSGSGQGSLITNILIAGVTGIGAFLIVWGAIAFFLAPVFASQESKAVRNILQIRHYWPGTQDIQLDFGSDAAAELVTNLNINRLLRRE